MKKQSNVLVLLLGSNLNDRFELLEKMRIMVSERIGKVTNQSNIYESEPWGFNAEHWFLNQVLVCETSLSAKEILCEVKEIENVLGRIKKDLQQYESRTADIDILFYNNVVLNTSELTIPHKHIHNRLFTLLPLADVMGEYIHPVLNKTVNQLIFECTDNGKVKEYIF